LRELDKMAQNTTTEGAQHYMTWATAETAVCGANMVGRRNSAKDTNTGATTCRRCCEWLDEQAAEEMAQDIATARAMYDYHNL
jgi:hypothetical protein